MHASVFGVEAVDEHRGRAGIIGAQAGKVTLDSRSKRSQVTPEIELCMAWRIYS